MIVLLAACAAVAAAVEDVPPLTVVSGANGRYALKELAVLLDIKDRARQENLPVRLIAYNLGQLGECADGDAGKAAPCLVDLGHPLHDQHQGLPPRRLIG